MPQAASTSLPGCRVAGSPCPAIASSKNNGPVRAPAACSKSAARFEANTLIEYEFVVVRERGERLVYLAQPSGRPSAEFVSITASPSEVVFENAQHDFPQRVGYQRQGADLAAWVEGTRDGQTRRIDFHYRRAACPVD